MIGETDTHGGLIGILGPTIVDTVSPTPRQRALLAALALAGPAGADVDQLADSVWSGRPPRTARSALQNQMTRLRRQFGHDLIECDQARYRLGRPTDAEHFEREVAAAVGAAADARVRLLRRALNRWRGLPWTDIDCHAAEVERARLSELRSLAVERLAVAQLERGATDDCITVLRTEVESDPYRDRAWELLVLALARAGRETEARQTIENYSQRMFTEFGIEPADRCAALRALLETDPTIDVRSGSSTEAFGAAPPRPTRPHRRAPHTMRRCGWRPHRGPHRTHP